MLMNRFLILTQQLYYDIHIGTLIALKICKFQDTYIGIQYTKPSIKGERELLHMNQGPTFSF